MNVLVMETQRTELLNQLPSYGWSVVGIEEEYLEWWADEMWSIESAWSPVGCRAYLTFLVDPQSSSSRKKGEAVWAVKASRVKPGKWLPGEDEFVLDIGRGWKEELPDFLHKLSVFRS